MRKITAEVNDKERVSQGTTGPVPEDPWGELVNLGEDKNNIKPDQETILDDPHEHITGRVDSFLRNLKLWFYKTCSISNTTYDRILAEAENPAECIAVYMHLVRTARWQETNSVYANNVYLKNGLKLGEKKIKQVKSELKKMGLITYIQRRGEKGLMKKTYIKIKYLPSFRGIGTGGSKSTPPGNYLKSEKKQIFKENNEMLDIDEFNSGGSLSAIPDIRTTRKDEQMLEEYNEMLKENNNNPNPVIDNSAKGGPDENPVVAIDLRSVGEDYRRLELSFTDNQIQQHIKKYGSKVVSGALKHFEENINPESVESVKAYFMWILNNYEKVEPVPEPEKIPERMLTDDEKELNQKQNKIKDIETRLYNGQYGSGFNPGEDEESLSRDHEKAIKEMEAFKTTMRTKGLFPGNEVVTALAGKMGK